MQALAPDTALPVRDDLALPRWLLLGNLLAALLVATLAYFALAASLEAFRQRALDATASLTRGLAESIAADIGRIDVVLQTLVLDLPRVTGDGGLASPGLGAWLAEREALLPEIDGLRIADAQGRVSHGGGIAPGMGPSIAGLDFFQNAQVLQSPGLVISEPYQSPLNQRWVVALARRVDEADGAFAGIVYATVSVEHFQRLLAQVNPGNRGAVSLRSAQLRLVARRSPQGDPAAGLGTANVSPQLRAALQANPESGSYIARTALDGIERANSYRRVGSHPMIALVGLATDDYLGPWYREVAVVASLAALALAVLAGSSFFVHRAWQRERSSGRALQRELLMQRAFMQTASDGIHVLDREGRVVQCSDSFAAMLGYAPQEIVGLSHATWDPRYESDELAERFRRFDVGGRYRFTTRHRRKDGSLLDVEVVSVGVSFEGTDLLYCAARDVSERERVTRALRDSEALLDRTGRLARVGGWELDVAAGTVRWSAQTRQLLEVAPDYAPTPEDSLRFYEPEARPVVEEAVRAAVAEGTPWDLELPIVTARGRRLWVRTVGDTVRDRHGRVRLFGAVQDITERLQRTAELQREREMRAQIERHAAELDALLHERSEMLDVLAHEVRQPLNNASAALQSMAKALPGPADEDAAAQRLRRAQAVMGQVLASIDNTLAAAALLARAEPIQREDTDIDTLVAVAIGDFPAPQRARIHVDRETSTRTASMDMSLVRLALRNLLSNALKHSPPGAVVQVTLGDSDAPLALLIDVADSGPGVDAELVPRLFERGSRSLRPGAPPGHGLGLYIVRRVMELHGGRVALVRNGPTGATFRLVLVQAE